MLELAETHHAIAGGIAGRDFKVRGIADDAQLVHLHEERRIHADVKPLNMPDALG